MTQTMTVQLSLFPNSLHLELEETQLLVQLGQVRLLRTPAFHQEISYPQKQQERELDMRRRQAEMADLKRGNQLQFHQQRIYDVVPFIAQVNPLLEEMMNAHTCIYHIQTNTNTHTHTITNTHTYTYTQTHTHNSYTQIQTHTQSQTTQKQKHTKKDNE